MSLKLVKSDGTLMINEPLSEAFSYNGLLSYI